MAKEAEEKSYWEAVFAREDPWDYESAYEQRKYRHTLEMIPGDPFPEVLELGCAEGVFTQMLAEKAENVLAVDISERALERAKKRCASAANVRFQQHDIANGLPDGAFDLIVCSEVLYYLRDAAAVAAIARQMKERLPVGGHLLMTHCNMVSDDKEHTGFDFNEIGAKFIGETFSSEPGLEFFRELRTELYRVQLFRRVQSSGQPEPSPDMRMPRPARELICEDIQFEHEAIKRGGCVVTAAEARHCWVSPIVPVLMYHRVADDGPEALAPYRVSTAAFERQLAYLQRYGYHGLDIDRFHDAWFDKNLRPMPGKPVVLTFDDAYLDFYDNAWPLLKKYGFAATVFVPVDYVGGRAEWDSDEGDPARLMDWEQIAELQSQGVRFGSHGCSHTRLTQLSREEILADAKKSKETLELKLATPITSYCYPYATANAEIQRLIASAGYQSAVCGRGGQAPDRDNPHYVPRVEIFGSDNMDDFIQKLPAPQPAPEPQKTRYYRLRALRDRATYMDR